MSTDGEPRTAAIRRMFPVVRTIARRVQRLLPGADLDDLIGDGCIGLIRAVDTFDPARGTMFEPYARRLVIGAMLNGVRRADPVSERVRRELREAERERYALAGERGVLPTIAEMEQRRKRLRRARAAAFVGTPVSLDIPLPGSEYEPAARDQDIVSIVHSRQCGARLAGALRGLSRRQQMIVRLHYGENVSLRSISRYIKVSPQRVSQLHLVALAKLRNVMQPFMRP